MSSKLDKYSNSSVGDLLRIKYIDVLTKNMQTAMRASALTDGQKAMTQVELADRSESSRTTISQMLSSKGSTPDFQTICNISHALGTTPAFLLMGPDEWLSVLKAASVLMSINPEAWLKLKEPVAADLKNMNSHEVYAVYGLAFAEEMGLLKKPDVHADFHEGAHVEFHEDAINSYQKMKKSIVLGSAVASSWSDHNSLKRNPLILSFIGACIGSALNKE